MHLSKVKKLTEIILLVLLSIYLFSCHDKEMGIATKENIIKETKIDSQNIENTSATINEVEKRTVIENLKNENEKMFEKVARYPKVDGSTANIPMMAQIMADYLDIPLDEARNNYHSVLTTDTAWKYMTYKYSNDVDYIPQLILVYEPSEEIKEIIKKSENKLIIQPIGVDALVFIKNKNNPIENLSIEDLVNIYTGEIINWKSLGGEDKNIEAFQRNYNSGSQTLFTKLLMKDKTPMQAKESYYLAEMGDVITRISEYRNDANAIGYSVYYYAKKMYDSPDLDFFAVDGIKPSDETIQNSTYPFLNKYYLVMRADEPEDSEVRKLYDYILSEKGKESIRKAGYIPVYDNDEITFE